MKKLSLATAALCVLSANAFADETLKLRTVIHATNLQTQEVGDPDGHTLIMAKFTGLGSAPDGQVSNVYITTLSDMTKMPGEMLVFHYNITADDGRCCG
jgi:hypothetical protein